MKRTSLPVFILWVLLGTQPAFAGTCTSPAGNESDIKYNNDYHTYQFCNGTSWIAMGPGSCYGPQSGYQPTYPSGSGFFVLSAGTYTDDLDGYSAAGGHTDLAAGDAICLSELTTNTGWMGYSTANSAGLLTSAHVHAFLCDNSTCNNLTPAATYYFANAGDSSAGGASFTTDSNGDGPNDSANWAAANYFNGTYTYWTGNSGHTNTAWGTTGSGIFQTCGNDWNGGYAANTGQSSNSNGTRWDSNNTWNSSYLICVVNP